MSLIIITSLFIYRSNCSNRQHQCNKAMSTSKLKPIDIISIITTHQQKTLFVLIPYIYTGTCMYYNTRNPIQHYTHTLLVCGQPI